MKIQKTDYYAQVDHYLSIPIRQLYFEKYNIHPNIYGFLGEYDLEKTLKEFGKELIISANYKTIDGYDYICEGLLEIEKEFCLEFKYGKFELNKSKGHIILLYSNNITKNKIEKIFNKIKYCKIKETEKGNLNILCKNKNDFYLKKFNIKKPVLDIKMNYNDGFDKIHNIIINKLTKKDEKGIVMLHGKVGSGKTTYLRYLIHLIDKKIIFIPPDLTNRISSPDFIQFLIEFPNSILIIEDAENVIMKRNQYSNQGVANLLNLSDGLLGDCLRLQIITTFNINIGKIDEALTRKGRLIAKWEFKELESQKVKELSKKLGLSLDKSMTLSELYNQKEESFEEKEQKIGFILN